MMGSSKDILIDEIEKYKAGFNILIEYFDSIAEEEKPEVHKRLKELGL